MKVTEAFLVKKKACGDGIKAFLEAFPGGAVVNEDSVDKALLLSFDYMWFVHNCFTKADKKLFWLEEKKIWTEFIDKCNENYEKNLAINLINLEDCQWDEYTDEKKELFRKIILKKA